MLSRRMIMVSGLALLGGCAARATTGTPTTPPPTTPPPTGGGAAPINTPPVLVGPHPNWTGALGSGGPTPTDPTRVTAKPAASWWTPTLQRFTDDFIVGVIADAKGGIANVTFSGDVATTTVTTPSVRTYLDPNGVTKKTPLGYWISLDHSQFIAVSGTAGGTTGKINLWATVTANDTTMQQRVIGGTNVDGSDNFIEGKLPQQHYPRTTQYDWVKTIGTGGDFPTWAAMRTALKAAQPKSPHVTFITSGTYDCATLANPLADQWNGTEGYCVVDAAPGVTATLVRGMAFDPNNSGGYWDTAWAWFPGCNQIKFTGQGIILDTKNYRSINQTNNYQPFWFDGCKVVNSIKSLGAPYFGGGTANGWGPYRLVNNPAGSYVTDCYTEYTFGSYGQYVWANNNCYKPGHGMHNAVRLNFGNYERGASCEEELWGPDRMSASYSGSASSAKCRVYGYIAGCKVELVENGVVVKTVTFPNGSSYRNYQSAAAAGTTVDTRVSSLVAALQRPGWTITEIGDDTGWASWALNNGGYVELECKGTTQKWKTGIDTHTEYLQQANDFTSNPANTASENMIIWNNTIRDAFYSSCYFNDDAAQDMSLKFNVFDCGTRLTPGSSQWGRGRHVVIENNFLNGAIANNAVPGWDAYSSMRLNITMMAPNKPAVGPNAGIWPSSPGTQDNMWPLSPNGAPSGAMDSGNIAINQGSDAANRAYVEALFTSRSAGDYRPASGGALTTPTNLRAKRRDYDGRGNPIAATDAIGPWAIGYSAPAWPF
ncbi:MAG: hypothetical protein ACREE0_08415 [Phenylobacterium sp.]